MEHAGPILAHMDRFMHEYMMRVSDLFHFINSSHDGLIKIDELKHSVTAILEHLHVVREEHKHHDQDHPDTHKSVKNRLKEKYDERMSSSVVMDLLEEQVDKMIFNGLAEKAIVKEKLNRKSRIKLSVEQRFRNNFRHVESSGYSYGLAKKNSEGLTFRRTLLPRLLRDAVTHTDLGRDLKSNDALMSLKGLRNTLGKTNLLGISSSLKDFVDQQHRHDLAVIKQQKLMSSNQVISLIFVIILSRFFFLSHFTIYVFFKLQKGLNGILKITSSRPGTEQGVQKDDALAARERLVLLVEKRAKLYRHRLSSIDTNLHLSMSKVKIVNDVL